MIADRYTYLLSEERLNLRVEHAIDVEHDHQCPRDQAGPTRPFELRRQPAPPLHEPRDHQQDRPGRPTAIEAQQNAGAATCVPRSIRCLASR